jgi:hypothetical protein
MNAYCMTASDSKTPIYESFEEIRICKKTTYVGNCSPENESRSFRNNLQLNSVTKSKSKLIQTIIQHYVGISRSNTRLHQKTPVHVTIQASSIFKCRVQYIYSLFIRVLHVVYPTDTRTLYVAVQHTVK